MTERTNDDEREEIEDEDEPVTTIHEMDGFVNIYVVGDITSDGVSKLVEVLMAVSFRDEPPEVVNLFLDSKGGDMHAAFKLIDCMELTPIPIRTIGWGQVASAALLIFMAGQHRVMSRNASIMSHHATFYASHFSVQVNNLVSHQKEFKNISDRITNHYEVHSGMTLEHINTHLLGHSDAYMDADEAYSHGLVDNFLHEYEGVEWLKSSDNTCINARSRV